MLKRLMARLDKRPGWVLLPAIIGALLVGTIGVGVKWAWHRLTAPPWNLFIESQMGYIKPYLHPESAPFAYLHSDLANQTPHIRGKYLVYYCFCGDLAPLDDRNGRDLYDMWGQEPTVDVNGHFIDTWSADLKRQFDRRGNEGSVLLSPAGSSAPVGVGEAVAHAKQRNGENLLAPKSAISTIVLVSPFFVATSPATSKEGRSITYMTTPFETKKIGEEGISSTTQYGFVGLDLRIYDIATRKLVAVKRFDRMGQNQPGAYPIIQAYEWLDSALDDKERDARETAVEKLTDQAALANFALEDNEPWVREAAVKKLSDQMLLAKLALESTVENVQAAAVKKLEDPALLAKVAIEDKSPWIRQAAVGRLTDQTVLAQVALESTVEDAGEAAVEKLTDQTLLAKVATHSSVDDFRQAAVEKLTDQAILAKVALEDGSVAVCKAAVEKLTDPALLAKVASDGESSEARFDATQRLNTLERRAQRGQK